VPVLQRLLLVPLLSPLLAMLLVSAINPRPGVSVRLLTWSSPAWPLGGWLAAAAGLGAAMSAGGTALALQGQGGAVAPRRQVRRRSDDERDDWQESRSEPARSTGAAADPPQRPFAWAGPARGAGEPAPTVSVPFRVIRKGTAAAASTTPPTSPARAQAQAPTDDNSDWNAAVSEDW
jgi:hypothetical protein